MLTVGGIDVAKATLAVATCDGTDTYAGTLGSVANSVTGWEALDTLPPNAACGEPLAVVLKPTGGYEVGVAL